MNRRPSTPLLIVGALVGLFLIAPTVVVLVMSFSSGLTLHFPPPGLSLRWYQNFFHNSQWTSGVWTSVKVGAISTVLATVLGTLAALGFARGRFPLRGAIMVLVVSPMIVPVIIIAVGMYLVFVRWGLQGTLWGMVAAHTSLGLPLVVVMVVASLQNFDRNLEMAAQNLGAGPIRTFTRVTLPLIFPGVVAGALFAFITSWDEVVVSSFLASPFVRTLPVVMWDAVRTSIDPTIAALAAMLSAFTIVLLTFAMLARRLGSRKR